MTRIRAASGAALGSDHRALGKNLQDAAAARSDGVRAWGVVSDGCGSGRRSEVGAQLTVEVGMRVLSSAQVALEEVPALVLAEVVRALGAVVDAVAPRDRRAFVEDCLSATLLGFLVREGQAIVFGVGDGTMWVADETVVLDRGGRPEVPAHAIFGAPVIAFARMVSDVHFVGVATDGVPPGFREELPPFSGPTSRGDLTRHLVLLGRRGLLVDDGAVAVAVRNSGGPR
jgi:hypothetical protein